MKFLVAQIGARRGYAVPQVLAEAGLLDRFYTDMTASHGLGKAAWSLRGVVPPLRRLDSRRVPQSLQSFTQTFESAYGQYLIERGLRKAGAFGAFTRRLGSAMSERGLGKATHFYNMMGELTPLLRTAHRADLETFTEIFILLSAYRKVDEECRKFPGIQEPTTPAWREHLHRWLDEVLSLTKKAIVPSDSVASDLVENFGFPAERVGIVPYSVDASWFSVRNEPLAGRVLFAGTAELRKGVQYAGLAAQKLGERHFQFRVAGNVERRMAGHAMMSKITFLGRISQEALKEEMSLCDVFILPTLGEGSAEVVYQAMAAGLPTITTPAAGSVITHGADGWIVQEGNAEALAEAVLMLKEDRPLRDRIARQARLTAGRYTTEDYGRRLLGQIAPTHHVPTPANS